MKKLPLAAAAALLFGSSAYAMIPSTQPTGVWVEKDAFAVQPTTALGDAVYEAPAFQPASADWWAAEEPVAYQASDYVKAAAAGEAVKAEAMADQAAMTDAVVAAEEDAIAADVQLAADTSEVQAAPAEPVLTGTGGPYEPVEVAAADLAPRPAAQNYPACRPGPGDDHCIQLYEPGVEQRLASWDRPTGGFAGASDTQVAMGGPYEPLDDSAVETARADTGAYDEGNVALGSAETDDEDMIEV